MAAHSGIDGKVTDSSDNTIANLDEWSLDMKNGLTDQTEFTDTWEYDLKGILSGTGSLKGSFDEDDTYQLALQTAFLAGNTVGLRLYVDGTNYWSCTAYLTDLKSADTVKGKVTVEYAFKSQGAISWN